MLGLPKELLFALSKQLPDGDAELRFDEFVGVDKLVPELQRSHQCHTVSITKTRPATTEATPTEHTNLLSKQLAGRRLAAAHHSDQHNISALFPITHTIKQSNHSICTSTTRAHILLPTLTPDNKVASPSFCRCRCSEQNPSLLLPSITAAHCWLCCIKLHNTTQHNTTPQTSPHQQPMQRNAFHSPQLVILSNHNSDCEDPTQQWQHSHSSHNTTSLCLLSTTQSHQHLSRQSSDFPLPFDAKYDKRDANWAARKILPRQRTLVSQCDSDIYPSLSCKSKHSCHITTAFEAFTRKSDAKTSRYSRRTGKLTPQLSV